ncbi:MAG: GFA family protein [Rhodospirillales bacterium]|nr:GFA family protein [Rhodospirillales bacterium]
MTTDSQQVREGHCACGAVRYQMIGRPIFVHCCHCTSCQRESGTAFALNAMIESDRVTLMQGTVETVDTPSESGRGQKFIRCVACKVALWSHYGGAGDALKFIRVGTLQTPADIPPDIHIFTASKQPWVILPDDVPSVPKYYDRNEYWSADSLSRRAALV